MFIDDEELRRLIECITVAIDGKKGEKTLLTDFGGMTGIACRYFVICEGHSSPQVEAIVQEVGERTREQLGIKPFGVVGLEHCTWVVLDYGDVMVHVFQPKARQFYDLEHLWAASIYQLTVGEDLKVKGELVGESIEQPDKTVSKGNGKGQ